MKNKIKELRIKIDGLAQLVKELKPMIANGQIYCHSYETRETYDKLILAKAWLGKILQELGEETPYKNDGNRKTVEDIEETADTAKQEIPYSYYHESKSKNIDDIYPDWHELNHIEKVDWLREEIKNIMDKLHNTGFYGISFTNDQMGDNYCNYFYQHLLEARFWLGFELSRCRDESNK